MIINIIILAVIVISALIGFFRGFIKSVFGFAGAIIAIICATLFAPVCSDFLNERFVNDACRDIISESITDALDDDMPNAEKIIEAIDRFVFTKDISSKELAGKVENDIDAVDEVSSLLASRISRPLCNALSFFAIFIMALILVKILTFVLSGIFELPVLKQANKLLGLLFGLICGIIYVMILSRVFVVILPWLERTVGTPFSQEMIHSSELLGFFSEFNLFKQIINGVADFIS